MIRFQDSKLYLKGTCNFILCDTKTGEVCYQDNKFQTNNIQTSATLDPIRGGMGNPVATIIASDAAVNVTATSAAFSLFAKAAQVGSKVQYNAVAPVCQVVDATAEALAIDVSTGGTPVAQYGYSDIFCYVTEVGAKNYIATAGKSYPLDPVTGAISGFAAVSGKSYKVWYWVKKMSAQYVKLNSQFNPGIYHATAQMPVYVNQSGSKNGDQSSRVGWLYYIIPLLKMGAVANLTGDQTTPDTTELSGQALSFDEAVENGYSCDKADEGSALGYYIYVPDDGTEGVTGLAVIGGQVDVFTGGTKQIPVKMLMDNGELIQPDYSNLKWVASGAPEGTTVSQTGLITAGTTAGDFDVTVTYPATGEAQAKVVVPVSVAAAG